MQTLTWENYRRIFEMYPFQKYFVNSTIVAAASTALALILGSLAAYSFARFRTGGNVLRVSILSTQMLPAITLVIPFFLLARITGLLDVHAPDSRGSNLATATPPRTGDYQLWTEPARVATAGLAGQSKTGYDNYHHCGYLA